jgi:hypothetical protein
MGDILGALVAQLSELRELKAAMAQGEGRVEELE